AGRIGPEDADAVDGLDEAAVAEGEGLEAAPGETAPEGDEAAGGVQGAGGGGGASQARTKSMSCSMLMPVSFWNSSWPFMSWSGRTWRSFWRNSDAITSWTSA